MDIDTSSLSAARRNLVVISMGFILFALGEATLGDGEGNTTITILAGSITFKNPDVLVCFAWTMFAWFLLRFWQFSKHKADFQQYAIAMYYSSLMTCCYLKDNQSVRSNFDGSSIQSIWGDWKWPVEINDAVVISKWQIHKKLFIFLYVALTTEHFGQYYFPYCLAITALIITLITT